MSPRDVHLCLSSADITSINYHTQVVLRGFWEVEAHTQNLLFARQVPYLQSCLNLKWKFSLSLTLSRSPLLFSEPSGYLTSGLPSPQLWSTWEHVQPFLLLPHSSSTDCNTQSGHKCDMGPFLEGFKQAAILVAILNIKQVLQEVCLWTCVLYKGIVKILTAYIGVSLAASSHRQVGQIFLQGSSCLPCCSFLHRLGLHVAISFLWAQPFLERLLSWAAEIENSFYFIVEWLGSFCLYLSISEYPLRPYLLPPKGPLTCFSKEIKIFYLMTSQCKSRTKGRF